MEWSTTGTTVVARFQVRLLLHCYSVFDTCHGRSSQMSNNLLEHCRLRNCLTLFIVLFSHVDCHLFGRTNQSKSFKCYESGTNEFPLLSLSLLDCNKNRRDFFGPVHSIKLQILSKRKGYCQVRTILAKLLYYYTILYYYRQGFGSDTRFIGSGPIFLIFTTPDRDRQISFLIQIFPHMIIE